MKNYNKILIGLGIAAVCLIGAGFIFKVFAPAIANNKPNATASNESPSKPRFSIPSANAKEIAEMRTRNSKTWLLETRADGTSLLMWQGTIGDIHYKNNPDDPNEPWKNINTDIVPSDLENYDYEITKAGYKVYLKEKFNDGEIVRYEKNGEWLEIKPGALSWVDGIKRQLVSEPRDVLGFPLPDNPNQIYWANAYGGKLDFQFVAQPTRILKILAIENFNNLMPLDRIIFPDADNVYLELDLDFKYSENLKMKQTDKGTIEFKNPKGEIMWEFLQPNFWDSSQPERGGDSDFNISNDMTISIRVHYLWLKEAIFPVYVDPTFSASVATSADDVASVGTNFSTTNQSYAAGQISGFINDSAARFITINIPQGSTINSAYLTLVAAADRTATTMLTDLYAEATNTASQITSEADFNGRATTSGVAWDNIGSWASGTAYVSPDIATPVQEVINRTGWQSGNAINIFWKDRGSTNGALRNGASFDNVTFTTKPLLTIEYWVPKPPGVSPAGGGFLMF
jgi:hypothetical protein